MVCCVSALAVATKPNRKKTNRYSSITSSTLHGMCGKERQRERERKRERRREKKKRSFAINIACYRHSQTWGGSPAFIDPTATTTATPTTKHTPAVTVIQQDGEASYYYSNNSNNDNYNDSNTNVLQFGSKQFKHPHTHGRMYLIRKDQFAGALLFLLPLQ